MGYASYEITRNGQTIQAGYAIETTCEKDGCDEKTDRGLGNLCGQTPGGDEHGCGGYFCGQHLLDDNRCERCAATADDERREPCGEGHCRCYGQGAEHAECACGCDCPRDEDGQLVDD